MKIVFGAIALASLAIAACGEGPPVGQGGGTSTSTMMPPECDERHADCDGEAANGCEVHPADDAANCGGCGVVCQGAHASMGCDLAACFVDQCEPGYEDKDHAAATGCESVLTD